MRLQHTKKLSRSRLTISIILNILANSIFIRAIVRRPLKRGIGWSPKTVQSLRIMTASRSCLMQKISGRKPSLVSRKAVELAPDEYRYREALARRLMENKDYDAALTEYTAAAELAPNEFFAEQMGDQQIEIYRRQGTLVEKIDELEASLESFEQQKQLAKMYLKLGNVTNTLEILIQAKGLKPDDVQVNRWLVELYTKSGRRDEAVAIYNHLVQVDAGNAREYYSEVARLHLRAMDFDTAIIAAKQAIAHSPRNPEGHQLLATIEKQRGHYDTAVDSLKQANPFAFRLHRHSRRTWRRISTGRRLSGFNRAVLAVLGSERRTQR